MYGPPRPCKVLGRDNDDSCVNVSGLSRVDCCCSQAMMRCARTVSTNLLRAGGPLSRRTYGTPIELSRHHSSNLAICLTVPLGESGINPFVECSGPVEDHPGDPSDFVRQSNDDFVDVHAPFELVEPGAEPVLGAIEVHHA